MFQTTVIQAFLQAPRRSDSLDVGQMSYPPPRASCYDRRATKVDLMYGFLAFASGVLLSIMLQMNGGLSAHFGIYHAALYIHIIGVSFALAALLLRRKRVSAGREQPAWMDQARARHGRKRVSPEREQPTWMDQARAGLDRKRVSPEHEQPAWMDQARARHGRTRVWLGRGLPYGCMWAAQSA